MYNANILKRKEAAAAKPLRPSDRLFRGRGRSALPLPLLPLLLPLLLLLADVTAASAAVLLRRYCRAHYIYIVYYIIYFRFSFEYTAVSARTRPLTERPQ